MFFEMLLKRKSFHKFKDIVPLSKSELKEIEDFIYNVKSLDNNIKTSIKIVETNKTTCNAGGEYCVLIYSEKKPGWLENSGYIGQQIDLFLESKNYGSLWFGIGTAKNKKVDGLYYSIMLNFSKINNPLFRDSDHLPPRKEISEIWEGEEINNLTNIIRYAPSAVNKQPWFIKNFNSQLELYYKKPNNGLIPMAFLKHLNGIDLGIFMCFIEICLEHNNIKFERITHFDENLKFDQLIATYKLI